MTASTGTTSNTSETDDAYYEHLVADWPPLTSEQVQVIRRALVQPERAA